MDRQTGLLAAIPSATAIVVADVAFVPDKSTQVLVVKTTYAPCMIGFEAESWLESPGAARSQAVAPPRPGSPMARYRLASSSSPGAHTRLDLEPIADGSPGSAQASTRSGRSGG